MNFLERFSPLFSLLRRLNFAILYLGNPPWDTGVSPPELIAFIQKHPPGKALDLGCGTGTNVITLAQHGWQAVGVDFSGRAIHIARRKARAAGVDASFHIADVTRLGWLDNCVHLVLDIGCFHNLNEPEKRAYISQLQRLLLPGGSFFLYTFIRPNPEVGQRGVLESDLDMIGRSLQLVWRKDGYDRNQRASAWLEYVKKP